MTSPAQIKSFFDRLLVVAATKREARNDLADIKAEDPERQVDWTRLCALAVAHDDDLNNPKGSGNRVEKLLAAGTYANWYAEMMGIGNSEQNTKKYSYKAEGADAEPPPATPSSGADDAGIDRPEQKNAPARNSGRIKGGPARARASRAARSPAAEPAATDNVPRTAVMAGEGVAGPGALAAQTASGPPKDALPVPSPAAQDGSVAAGDVLSSPAAPDSEPALVEALIDRGEAGAAGDTVPGAGSPPAAEPGDGPIPVFLRRDPAAKWWGGM